MQFKSLVLNNLTLVPLLIATLLISGCQKESELTEQDAAIANADRSAQAAQAATDAAMAAVPNASIVTETSAINETP
jgi:hypothetical protein